MKIILTKNEKLWERFDILHETEFMIHGVSNVDLDWAEAIGIAKLFISQKLGVYSTNY